MDLATKIKELEPWHYDFHDPDFPVPQGKYTRDVRVWKEPFLKLCRKAQIEESWSVLDVACNAGVRCFHLLEEWPGLDVVGFEARDLWLKQCQLLQWFRRVDFAVTKCFVEDWVKNCVEEFDLTLLGGILYHLAAPEEALDMFLERTRKAVYINTNVRTDFKDTWVRSKEDPSQPLNGIVSNVWVPSLGVIEQKLQADWRIVSSQLQQTVDGPANTKRLVIMAIRKIQNVN